LLKAVHCNASHADVSASFAHRARSGQHTATVFDVSGASDGTTGLACDRHGTVLEASAGSGPLTQELITHFGRERLQIIEWHRRWWIYCCSAYRIRTLLFRFNTERRGNAASCINKITAWR